jgi:hypothetical protein
MGCALYIELQQKQLKLIGPELSRSLERLDSIG